MGLLTGGILAGQSLIRASELRSISTDLSRYQTAVLSFRDKYLALPGDMTNATSFWGAAHATPATCRTTTSTTSATCNGNGDGNISTVDGVTFSEYFHAWKQLANAGLVEGSYSGVAGTGYVANADAGINTPKGKISNSTAGFAYLPSVVASDPNWFEGNYGNFIFYGGDTVGDPTGWLLKPEEMWNIDTKIDDGKPGLGRFRSPENQTSCNTTTVAATAEYALTVANVTCSIIYILQ